MVTQKQKAKASIVRYWKDVAERAGRTFAQGYMSAWVIAGADFESLFRVKNIQYGAVACAFSIAMSLGIKNVGDKNSASALPVK